MKKHGRIIFFWSLVALFLIVATIVVLGARGFRFDFNRSVFVHSGLLSLKGNPAEFEVYLDGKLKTSGINRINNSINIQGLFPKEYDLTIKADGFQDWSKKVRIHSGKATEFWNLLLIRNEYARKEYSVENLNRFFISPKNSRVASTENLENGTKIKITNIQDDALEKEFSISEGTFDAEIRKENVEWSPEEDHLSVPIKLNPIPIKNPLTKNQLTKKAIQPEIIPEKYAYFIIQPNKNKTFNFNEFISKEDIKNVRWDPRDKNYLFFLSENSLFRANITKKEDLTLISEGVSSFDLSRSGIYYSQMPTELVFKTALDGRGEKKQITTDFPESLSMPNEKLIVYDEERIVFLNQNKDLFLLNRSNQEKVFKKIGEKIEGTQFSDDGKKLLYWSENEIHAYFLSAWIPQPTRVANENLDLIRFGEKIKNVQWFKDYEHVIFSVGNQFKIIELDSRDRRNVQNLPQVSFGDSSAVYNHSLELFFFTNKKDTSAKLYSIVFPEKTTFLGF